MENQGQQSQYNQTINETDQLGRGKMNSMDVQKKKYIIVGSKNSNNKKKQQQQQQYEQHLISTNNNNGQMMMIAEEQNHTNANNNNNFVQIVHIYHYLFLQNFLTYPYLNQQQIDKLQSQANNNTNQQGSKSTQNNAIQ